MFRKKLYLDIILNSLIKHKSNFMKKQFLSLIAMSAFAMFAASCANNDNAEENSVDTTVVMEQPIENGVMVGGAMMVPSKNIVENAMNSNEHTTLVAAVKQAGLVETLSGPGPYTVFAPTNAAFDKLPAGTVDDLMKDENKGKLTNVLTYHVVAGSYMAADLTDGQELTTVEGEKLKVTVKDGKVWIGNAEVTTADVVSSNGVTHVINEVLLPKKM